MDLRRFPRTEALARVTASLAVLDAVHVCAHQNRKEVAVADAEAVAVQLMNSAQIPEVLESLGVVPECQ